MIDHTDPQTAQGANESTDGIRHRTQIEHDIEGARRNTATIQMGDDEDPGNEERLPGERSGTRAVARTRT